MLSYVFPKKLEMDFQVLFPLSGTYACLLRLEVFLILIGNSGSRELGEEVGWSILCFQCIALPSKRVFQAVLKIIFHLVTEVISWIWFPPFFKKESEKKVRILRLSWKNILGINWVAKRNSMETVLDFSFVGRRKGGKPESVKQRENANLLSAKALFAAFLFERYLLIPQVKTCLHVTPLFIWITESRESPAGSDSWICFLL